MTQDQALSIWEYKDGHLYWRETMGTRATAGSLAGGLQRRTGASSSYCGVHFQGKNYLMHRVIFLMHKGFLPSSIDHIDGNSLNNRIENLRPCTRSQNQQNRRRQANNTSGFKGVSWNKRDKRWDAFIGVRSRKYRLGSFTTAEAAYATYKKAASELHGEFANFG